MTSATKYRFADRLLATGLLMVALTGYARIGVEFQMPLGNPSNATTDRNNHEHYLIQRRVFAMDYDDKNGEPNWVSWDLTADDLGPAKRSPAFKPDDGLPANFHHIKSADYRQSGFDRGHMCPSADRTDNAADNDMVFVMSNIIPQTPDNNEGVWEHLEADCREWAKAGNELLIMCGPSGFKGEHINGNGPVMAPTHTWKIVVVVPDGPGPVVKRINKGTKVIAVDIPNISGIRTDPWTKYQVSVSQLEAMTGFKFFTALAPDVAAALKGVAMGQATSVVAGSAQTLNWVPLVICILVFILILIIAVMVLFFRSARRQ